jgi:hypothetical protein
MTNAGFASIQLVSRSELALVIQQRFAGSDIINPLISTCLSTKSRMVSGSRSVVMERGKLANESASGRYLPRVAAWGECDMPAWETYLTEHRDTDALIEIFAERPWPKFFEFGATPFCMRVTIDVNW